MNAFRLLPVLVVFSAAFAVSCGSSNDEVETPATAVYAPNIDSANFTQSTVIDNRYFPLTPGTTFKYEGMEGDEAVRVEDFVTHDTKQIMGVTCVVVEAREWVDGQLAEETFDWFAQDNDGNVWYFGEDTKEYEDGEVVSTEGSWVSGVDGAQPGIIMQAEPQKGQPYRQEYYPGEAEDMGEVTGFSGAASVPYGSYDSLLVTREWTPLEPDVEENKYYASGVGLVLEEAVKGETARVELVAVTTE